VRQFFTDLIKGICDLHFEGDQYKLPIYSIANGSVMIIIGKIIVHSILHEGPGMPIFSLAVYNYLTTENSDTTLQLLTLDDSSSEIKYYIEKVRTSTKHF